MHTNYFNQNNNQSGVLRSFYEYFIEERKLNKELKEKGVSQFLKDSNDASYSSKVTSK